MFKKLLRVVIPVGIVTGLYFYGDSLPDTTASSGGASSAGAGATGRLDTAEYTIDVKKVGQTSSDHLVDVTVRAKVPLRIAGIEVHAGSTESRDGSSRRGQLVGGSEVRIENTSDINLKAGEARAFRGEAPRGDHNSGFFGDSLIRTSVKFHYPGGNYAWDPNNPRFRGVVDTRLR